MASRNEALQASASTRSTLNSALNPVIAATAAKKRSKLCAQQCRRLPGKPHGSLTAALQLSLSSRLPLENGRDRTVSFPFFYWQIQCCPLYHIGHDHILANYDL
jgi:hypothetical protein